MTVEVICLFKKKRAISVDMVVFPEPDMPYTRKKFI